MIPHRNNIGLFGAMLAAGLLVRDDAGLSAPARPAQTNAVEPSPERAVESRQVRRARERREAKNRR